MPNVQSEMAIKNLQQNSAFVRESSMAVKKRSSKPDVISRNDRLPPVNERVMVVCHGFRCLGYLDRDKVWRDAHRLSELNKVIGWYRIVT